MNMTRIYNEAVYRNNHDDDNEILKVEKKTRNMRTSAWEAIARPGGHARGE